MNELLDVPEHFKQRWAAQVNVLTVVEERLEFALTAGSVVRHESVDRILRDLSTLQTLASNLHLVCEMCIV